MISVYHITDQSLENHAEYVLRKTRSSEGVGPESVKSTFFTFTRQPSEDRWSTRVGGLPAWPVSLEWPSCEECGCDEPLAFVAQLDFRNNHNVEFDLLLFHYCFECNPWSPDGTSARVTLLKHAETGELVEEPVIPEILEGDEPGPCYGVPHEIEDLEYPDCAMGTKIGGVPAPIQPLEPVLDSAGNLMEFLACICSIDGTELETLDSTPDVGDLAWGDAGCVYFWYSRNGKGEEVTWNVMSY